MENSNDREIRGIRLKTGVGKIRRVMSNPHSKIDPNVSGY
jgi:hypothetical protein